MDLRLGERNLHVYDTGSGTPVFWFHGTPNLGLPPEPLFRDGVRWLSYDRPGYGGSTPVPGRTVGSAAADISHIADALGVDRFAVFGHSGCIFYKQGTTRPRVRRPARRPRHRRRRRCVAGPVRR